MEGQRINDIKDIHSLCVEAHEALCPKVPLCGWDVAFTKEHGMLLLEVNLSCNFFRGDFDQEKYFDLIETYMRCLESARSNN